MTHIVAVAPVHNEAPNIAELARRLTTALAQLSDDYGVMLVDDGSRDETWAEIRKASAADPRVEGLRFSRNFGQHVAITAGLDNVSAEWVVVLDGDLQDRPEVIPELYSKAKEGHDVVFVAREDRPESRGYQMGQRAFYGALRLLTGTDYDPRHGNFSIISRRVLERLQGFKEGSRFYGGLIEWIGYPRATIAARHGEREAGRPSYNLFKRIRFASDIILSFSTRPLYMALLLGAVSTAAAFAFGIIILVRALFSDYSVEGWASLMVSIYFIGGVQMLLVGMNGLYIGRMHKEIQQRPIYVIAEATDGAQSARNGEVGSPNGAALKVAKTAE